MAEAMLRDVLFRMGGRTLQRYKRLVLVRGARGWEEVAYTHTRADAATCARYFDGSGNSLLAAANKLRLQWEDLDGDGVRETPGILLEGTRTNVVLHNRDMTNAAWTKTNVSAVKDQTGIDGVASSASRITASAGNGTCLQAIVLASSVRFQSCYIKRLVGTGVIEMTMDNGATYTPVTVTSAWTRVTIPTQTLANPTVGFRIVTSGDSIAVDMVQNENGIFQTSPIATAAASVVRAADALSIPVNFGPVDITALARIARPIHADTSGTIGGEPRVFELGTLAPDKRISMNFINTARQVQTLVDGTTNRAVLASIPAGAELSLAGQFKNMTTGGQTTIDVGSGYASFSTATEAFAAYGNQTLLVGSGLTAGNQLNGVLTDLIICRGLFTRSEMLAL